MTTSGIRIMITISKTLKRMTDVAIFAVCSTQNVPDQRDSADSPETPVNPVFRPVVHYAPASDLVVDAYSHYNRQFVLHSNLENSYANSMR